MDRKVLGAVVAALALALASCGGSDTLSRADFVKQANAICKRRTVMIAATQQHHRNDVRGAIEEALPVFAKTIDGLASLHAPAESKASISKIIAIERAQLGRIRAIAAGHRPSSAESLPVLHEQSNLKRQLGLESCV
jgi:hypothetical protein